MTNQSGTDDLTIRYGKSTTLRALIRLIPFGIGGASDVVLMKRVETIKAERIREFFDQLDRGSVQLSEELISSEDFLHCFFATTNAALKTRRREKIRLLANLLKSAFSDQAPRDTDEYEELLDIINDMSLMEWKVLLCLDSYSLEPRERGENLLQWSTKFWDRFLNEVEGLGVPKAEVRAFLSRISRTGLYEQFVGSYLNYTGGMGHLTPRFHRLKKFLTDCSESSGGSNLGQSQE